MKWKKVLLAAQSVLCVILAVMLITAVLGIYREGLALKAADPLHWIYSREKAVSALRPVLPLIVLSLVMTAAGLLVGIRDENAEKPVKDTEYLRDLAVSRVKAPSAAMREERMRQRRLLSGGWAVFALCMVPVLLYIGNGKHFPEGNLEPVFYSLIGHVLPWTALGLAALMISTVLQEKSMQREIGAAKEQRKAENTDGIRPNVKPEKKKAGGGVHALRIVLLVLAVLLIAAGIWNGGAGDVFGKAVNICTECIGLG